MLFLLFSCLNDETAVNDEEVVVGVDENESGLASKLVRGKRIYWSPTKLGQASAPQANPDTPLSIKLMMVNVTESIRWKTKLSP